MHRTEFGSATSHALAKPRPYADPQRFSTMISALTGKINLLGPSGFLSIDRALPHGGGQHAAALVV